MTVTKFQDQTTQAGVAWIVSLILLTSVMVVGLGAMIGCDDSSAAHDATVHPPALHADDHGPDSEVTHPVLTEAPESLNGTIAEQEPEAAPEQEPGVLDKAGDLLKKATAKGGQTAKGAGKWVQDKWGSAADAGDQSAEETWNWANETFEMLKSKGLTTASDTSQWLEEDWSNMESWEYKVVTLGDTDEGLTKTLNELGKQGWECFETENKTDGTRFYFKKRTFSYLRHLPFKDLIKLAPLMNNGEK